MCILILNNIYIYINLCKIYMICVKQKLDINIFYILQS